MNFPPKSTVTKSEQKKKDSINRILIFLGLTIILSLFLPGGRSLEYNYELNDITREEIVAQFNFSILKEDEQLEAEIEEEKRNVPYLFERKQEIVDLQTQEILTFFEVVNNLHSARKKYTEIQAQVFAKRYTDQYVQIRKSAFNDSLDFREAEEFFQSNYSFKLENPHWEYFIQKMTPNGEEIDYNEFQQKVINICRNRWAEGIFNIPKSDIISDQVEVISGDFLERLEIFDFNDRDEAWGAKTKDEIADTFPEDSDLYSKIAYEIIVEFMKPNVIYDEETTKERQEAAIATVPRSQGIVMKNERIVDANTRVTPEVLLKLRSYAYELDTREGAERGLRIILPWIGRFMLVGAILSFFFIFLRTYRGALFEENKVVLLFCSLLLFMGALSYLIIFTIRWPEHLRPEYLIPITVLAMLVTILFDARIAVMAAVTLSILIGFIIGNRLDFVIVSLFTSIAAIYATRKLRARAQLFSAILYIVISGLCAITAFWLLKRTEWITIRYDFLFITISGVLAPFITFGLSALIEILFGVTSDLTLLELSDFNHPLLKRLSQEANGTFNHCVVVGNMAESCANAIGTNPLLCRVGSYYHDIGKLTRPEYFIENQFRGENKHDKLSPTLSARIILNHVKDGLKLAKEYRLPPVVTDFIPMHHGTSRLEYFYQKALDLVDHETSKVNETGFHYAGPKPNTKETGILMICETVEAAVRSIKSPDLRKIVVMVSKIIKKHLEEGQLDNCPLTMRDLSKLKGDVRGGDGLLPVLRGIYHLRIEYPDQQKSSIPAAVST